MINPLKNPIFIIALTLLSLVATPLSAASGWLDDFEKAKEIAKEENKPILMDFTGSDWCGWCIKLDKEVFSKSEFKKYAKENLVLMEVDFPAKKKLKKSVEKQNDALQKEYDIKGYPTIVLVDAEGKEIARTGYKPGGAEAYVQHLKKLLDK